MRLPLRRLGPLFGAVAVLAVVAVVVTVVRGLGDAACAAVPVAAGPPVAAPVAEAVPVAVPVPAEVPAAGEKLRGKATFYDGTKGGNCSYGPPADPMYVALATPDYTAGAACGTYLDVAGPKGSVRVQVTDSCPTCAQGDIDLSPAAFKRIADPVQGIVPVSYTAVRNPRLPAGMSFRVKEGSSRWWLALLPYGHGNALRRMEVRGPSGSWQPMARTDYGYWVAASGAGDGPFSVRVTDIYGSTRTVTGLSLAPSQWQRTAVRLYGAAAPPRTTPSRSAGRSPSAKPSPSTSASPSRRALALAPPQQGAGAPPPAAVRSC